MIMKTILEEFKSFSADLQLSSGLLEKAQQFIQDVTPAYVQCGQKISRKALFACAIFIVAQDKNFLEDHKFEEGNAYPEITVTKLLEKADIHIMDFFSVTCFLKTNYPMNENIKQNLIALERKYLIVSAVYDKFESMTNEIFYADDSMTTPKSLPSSSKDQESDINKLLKDHKALCWMLFLVAKAKILWHRQELLATFHLLLCCIGEVVRTAPSFLLSPPFANITMKYGNPLSVLEVLSSHFSTRYEEVKAVYDGWLHVASELKVESKLPEVQHLTSIYEQLYRQTGDVNESLFLNKDWHLLPSTTEQNSPRKNQPTSVRITLATSEALNTILHSPPGNLNQSLQFSLQKCLVDAPSIIQQFLAESKDKFVKEFVVAQESSDRSLAERRYKLASSYYYIMLDALLKKESTRLGRLELSSFIQNMIFHKSLLACCIEVTLMSCGSVAPVNFTPVPYGGTSQAQGTIFPWILQVFDLEAFHFFKIIESFIRGAPKITLQIINHLKAIEDKICESLAWKTGSSVFGGIAGSGCSSSCKAKFVPSQQSPNMWSPNKNNAQQSPSTPHTCHAVNLFLNKVCRLAYQRLEKLCLYLDITQKLVSDIWVCLEHVMYKKTHLLLDRHIDQIMMCCIFAVCKARDEEVRFKTITSSYHCLQHASASIYKSVMTKGKKEYIIKFYNQEFHEEMESYIITNFSRKNEVPASIHVSPSSAVLSPFYSLPNKKNIFVSPLQESPFKNPNEVIVRRTIGSYTFGSLTQSPKTLQDINSCLNAIVQNKDKEVCRGKKRLVFDSESGSQKETSNSARKFLKFDQPDCSVSFQKATLKDTVPKN